MKETTKMYIQRMLLEEIQRKKVKLDQALIDGRDVKTELENYKTALLVREDFEKGDTEHAAG